MNNFTFSNPIQKNPKNHSDEAMENYESWAERIKGGSQCNNLGKPKGAWRRRNLDKDDDDSDSNPSPELWKQNRDYSYYDTDNPRAQSIAKYRQEMLNLVRGMPETAYELSLRDLVESPKITTPLKGGDEEGDTKKIGKRKERRGGRTISRSESMDKGGLMLKMMFIPRIPSVFGGKKSNDGLKTLKSTGTKVSPKPVSGDREWWNDEFGAMNSGSGSSSSSNTSGKRNRKLMGCFPYFQTR